MLISVHPKLPMRNKLVTHQYYVDKLGFKVLGSAEYPAYLMVEWRMQEDGRDVISSVHCDNPNLHNLGGGDCTWSCWEKLS